jgi:D-sedoheptulose 7-phosphate isomerase
MDAVDRYLDETLAAIARLSRADIRLVVDALEAVYRADRTVFLIGNGGSASTASHMMNDLCKFTVVERRPRFRAISLTDNVPLLTALGNDVAFSEIFVEPLRSLARPGDALIAISGSGNSPNIVRAVEYEIEHDIRTIGLCGSPGGRLAALAELRIIVPADRIGQQEDGHLILNHTIATALRERIERAPDPALAVAAVGA